MYRSSVDLAEFIDVYICDVWWRDTNPGFGDLQISH